MEKTIAVIFWLIVLIYIVYKIWPLIVASLGFAIILGGIGLAIFLAYMFIRYVLPVLVVGGLTGTAVVLGVILIVGAAVGFTVGIRNYFQAIRSNINFNRWDWTEGDEPADRSYFFGPGYRQLRDTIRDAFKRNRNTVNGNARKFIIYRLTVAACVYLLGSVITVVFSLIHGSVTTAVMLVTYVVFSIIWLLDRIYLFLHRIRSVCPVCHRKALVPHFVCPQCGEVHKRLVPGVYGVLNHTCYCGYRLPATFFNGRSRMDSVCPFCTSGLVASDARQIGIQLIGGSRSGKSVLLAALFHEYLKRLKGSRALKAEITDEYRPYFDELEGWYEGGDVPPTESMNAQMYPLLLSGRMNTKRQMSVYDIAGEMFDGAAAENETLQLQFHYCDGLMFVLDPFSDGDLRKGRISRGEALNEFSDMRPDDVAGNFIRYLTETGKAKVNERSRIPMAVLIVKSDMREVKKEIGPVKLWTLVKKGQYSNYDEARDAECRRFLNEIGLSLTVDTLEAGFSNLHYFPVSAMGHSPDGDAYEPWGIMEVLDWMMPQIDSELYSLTVASGTK